MAGESIRSGVSCCLLQSTDGTCVEVEIENSERMMTLYEIQKDLLKLFEKDLVDVWVSLAWKSVTYTNPKSQPFLSLSNGDVFNVLFEPNQLMNILFSFGRCRTPLINMTVRRMTILGDLQCQLLAAFAWQDVPIAAAIVDRAGLTYCDMNDMPFAEAQDGDEFRVTFDSSDVFLVRCMLGQLRILSAHEEAP